MYQLSDEQIAFILNDIRRRGVVTEDLQYNLLDHICCIIEQNLEEQDGFGQCYETTIRQFYAKELAELEEETINLLTFKNYYVMKKMMFISGGLTSALFVVGAFFKVMWWPGAAALLFTAMVIFGFLFLPLLFILKLRESVTLRDKWIIGIGALLGLLYCASILFQIQHWPGKQVLWLSTLALSFFVFIPLYFFTGIRRPETRVNTFVSTIILIAATALQFTATGLHTHKDTPQQPGSAQATRVTSQ